MLSSGSWAKLDFWRQVMVKRLKVCVVERDSLLVGALKMIKTAEEEKRTSANEPAAEAVTRLKRQRDQQ